MSGGPSAGFGSAGGGQQGDELLAMVFKRYPFVLSLRERYVPVSKETSFAMLPHFSTTEAEHALRREDVLNLIHQWLLARGFVRTASELCYDAALEPWDLGIGSDLLVHLLQAAAPVASSVFAAESGVVGNDEDDDEVEVNDDLTAVEETESPWADEEPSPDAPIGTPVTLAQICRLLLASAGSGASAAAASGAGMAFRSVVASTWSAWTTAKDFLQCLFQLYNVPEGLMSAEDVQQFQMRVVRVVVWFVVTGGGPMELVSGLVSRFAGRLFELGKSKNAADLRQGIARAAAALESEPIRSVKNWEEPQVPKNIFSAGLALGDVPVAEVARQLTLIDWELYSKVTSSELLGQGWLASESERRAPRVAALLRRFSAVEAWARGSVLQEEQRKNSSDVLGYFVALARALVDLRSYHSAAAVWGGLSGDAVWRLRPAWNALTPELKSAASQLEQTLSCWRGFASYRRLLSEHAAEVPVVPLFLAHLQPLALASHASPSKIGPAVNMAKFAQLHRLVDEVLQHQKSPFPFLVVAQIQSFLRTEKLAVFQESNT